MALHYWQRPPEERDRILREGRRNEARIARELRRAQRRRRAEFNRAERDRRAQEALRSIGYQERRRDLRDAAECKTCGGSGRVWRRLGRMANGGTEALEVPCPSCKPKQYKRRMQAFAEGVRADRETAEHRPAMEQRKV